MQATPGLTAIVAAARPLIASGAVLAALTLGSASALAATRWVNDTGTPSAPGSSCSDPGYKSIQAAINAADDDDKIFVCQGTYTEQLDINGKSLKIRARDNVEDVIVQSPDVLNSIGGLKSIVTIRGSSSDEVKFKGFTVRGGIPGCNTIDAGFFVRDSAKGIIALNHIEDVRNQPFAGGCGTASAVRIGSDALGTSGQATVVNNDISGYQRAGVTVDRHDTSVYVRRNDVQGEGDTDELVQVGIEVINEARGRVQNNTVHDNVYGPNDAHAVGILLQNDPDDSLVSDNEAYDNDDNIAAISVDSTDLVIRNNDVHDGQYDGISLLDVNEALVEDNTVDGNGRDGIRVDNSDDNDIRGNSMFDNDDFDAHEISSDGNNWDNNSCDHDKPSDLCD